MSRKASECFRSSDYRYNVVDLDDNEATNTWGYTHAHKVYKNGHSPTSHTKIYCLDPHGMTEIKYIRRLRKNHSHNVIDLAFTKGQGKLIRLKPSGAFEATTVARNSSRVIQDEDTWVVINTYPTSELVFQAEELPALKAGEEIDLSTLLARDPKRNDEGSYLLHPYEDEFRLELPAEFIKTIGQLAITNPAAQERFVP